MGEVIDLVRVRRMRFEAKKTEKELAIIDFDVYGNPIELKKNVNPTTHHIRDRMSPGALKVLIRAQPELAKKLDLFPKLEVLDGDEGSKEA